MQYIGQASHIILNSLVDTFLKSEKQVKLILIRFLFNSVYPEYISTCNQYKKY